MPAMQAEQPADDAPTPTEGSTARAWLVAAGSALALQVDPALLELGELAGSVALASTQGMARATAAQMREHARNLQKRLAPLGARAVDRVVRRAERASGSVLDKRARLKELQDSWNDLLTCVRATRR